MSLTATIEGDGPKSGYRWHDVRFIGALSGRYALPDRRSSTDDKIPVYACRLCSISTRLLVAVGPVIGKEGELVSAHFDEFGIIRGRITRRLASGFVTDIIATDIERDKLGAKIEWQKKRVLSQVPDKREHKRFLPRDPRSMIVTADGTRIPCFIIDVSQSGVAVSAHFWPEIGTPMAVGKLVGRVVRYLDVGFAVEFIQLVPQVEDLEGLLLPPTE